MKIPKEIREKIEKRVKLNEELETADAINVSMQTDKEGVSKQLQER